MSEMYNECREYARHVAEEIEVYYNGTAKEDGEQVKTSGSNGASAQKPHPINIFLGGFYNED